MTKYIRLLLLCLPPLCLLLSVMMNVWYDNFKYFDKVNLVIGFDIMPDEFVSLIRLGSITMQLFLCTRLIAVFVVLL